MGEPDRAYEMKIRRPGILLLKLRRPSRKGAALLQQRRGAGAKPSRRLVRQALADIERGLEDTERRGVPSNVPARRK